MKDISVQNARWTIYIFISSPILVKVNKRVEADSELVLTELTGNRMDR